MRLHVSIFTLMLIAVFLIFATPTVHAQSDHIQSPKKQLDAGVLLDDIVCRKNLILVERSPQNIACVTENLAEKLSWKIIKPIVFESNVDEKFDTSITTEDMQELSGPISHTLGYYPINLSISKLPNIGETAVVTVLYDNNNSWGHNFEKGDVAQIRLLISKNFEFVDLVPTHNFTMFEYRANITSDGSDILSFSTTIRAISEGKSQISSAIYGDFWSYSDGIRMYVSENTTSGWPSKPIRDSTPEVDLVNEEYDRRLKLVFPDKDIRLSISNLPNIGETAIVTITTEDFFASTATFTDIIPLGLRVTPGLEIVDDGTLPGYDGSESYLKAVNIVEKESVSISVTIRAVSEGISTITGIGSPISSSEQIILDVSQNTTRVDENNS